MRDIIPQTIQRTQEGAATVGSQRLRRRRIALGHHADARSNAETALADPQSVNRIIDWTDRHDTDAQPPPRSMTSMVNAAVERVRRHFGAANLETGNRYARVARAMLNHRHWSLAGIPKSSFSHARKKIKLFLEACKIKAESL